LKRNKSILTYIYVYEDIREEEEEEKEVMYIWVASGWHEREES